MTYKRKQSKKNKFGFLVYIFVPIITIAVAAGLRFAVADSTNFEVLTSNVRDILYTPFSRDVRVPFTDSGNSFSEVVISDVSDKTLASDSEQLESEHEEVKEIEEVFNTLPVVDDIVSTSTPRPETPTPQPTLTPTPEPTPKIVEHCSVHLTYNIGYIDHLYFEKGFTRYSLTTMVQKAEQQWEDAVGIDLFNRTDDAKNLINFVDDYTSASPGHYGFVTIGVNEYESVDKFSIDVFNSLFTFAESPLLIYFGEAVGTNKLRGPILDRIILHLMGHAFGLEDIDNASENPEMIMGKGNWIPYSYTRVLSERDKDFAKDFCEN